MEISGISRIGPYVLYLYNWERISGSKRVNQHKQVVEAFCIVMRLRHDFTKKQPGEKQASQCSPHITSIIQSTRVICGQSPRQPSTKTKL